MSSKKLHDLSKEELISLVKELKSRKKYGLVWEDKPEDVVEQCKKELPVLKEVEKKAILKAKDQPTNLIIEGDNYHALSALSYTHAGKIDVIYIDPPYNTGKRDFRYNDKWIEESDVFRHSKWLSFMYKRVELAKKLLKSDGILLISIDDNEVSQLRLLCDNVFGEENLLSVHHIQVRYGNKNLNEKKDFQELLEYVLVYAKEKSSFSANRPKVKYSLERFNLVIKELKGPDMSCEIRGKKVDIFKQGSYSIYKKSKGEINLFKETWLSGSIYSGTGHGKTYQNIVEKRVAIDGLATLYKIHGLGEDGLGFRYMINPQRPGSSRGRMFTKVPITKKRLVQTGESHNVKPIINYYDFSPDFGNIVREGGVGFNSGKKPVKLMKQLIGYHANQNVRVLDFFAGSGTTGHAVLELNKEDGGNRQFILCTNNENKIAEEVCYPRIKKVIEGYADKKGIPANVRYFKTDFVPKSAVSDDTRRALMDKSIDMICIRENAFDKVKVTSDYKIFRTNEKVTGILINLDKIDTFKKELAKLRLPAQIYVFSLTNDTYDEDFKDLEIEYELVAVPESILEVYRKIFKE